VLTFEDTDVDELGLDGGLVVPRIRMTGDALPDVEIVVGGRLYAYERSYPIKGHGATLPPHIRGALDEGKKPLVIERPERFYLYIEK